MIGIPLQLRVFTLKRLVRSGGALAFAVAMAGGLLSSAHMAPAQAAQAAEELGPPVGAQIDIGTLSDQTGAGRDLASLMGENGVVLAFVRSADWCPFCQAQLIELGETVDQITARGYGLVSISYDSVEILDMFTQRRSIGYVMLSDPNSEVIDALGLREPRYELGHRAYGVPKPIIFVLDTEGIVQAKLYEEDYRARPPGSLIVETLDEVSD